LAEGATHVGICDNIGKSAFTLAEVLITLAIIGVVAAMTIPTLISNYQEKVTVTKIKKTYAVLSNALALAIVENGPVNTWGITNTVVGSNENGEIITDNTQAPKLFAILSKHLKGTTLPYNWYDGSETFNLQKKSNSGGAIYADPVPTDPTSMQLPDGVIVEAGQFYEDMCNNDTDLCTVIGVYLPNNDKKYYLGHNYFYFYLGKNKVYAAGYRNDLINSFDTMCNISNNSYGNGRGCTAWIVENGNMDYLHCDDLSWDGKRKCSD